jgi:hypothetical protein
MRIAGGGKRHIAGIQKDDNRAKLKLLVSISTFSVC